MEGDTKLPQPFLADEAASAIDNLVAVVLWQPSQHGTGEDVATLCPLVAKNAVE